MYLKLYIYIHFYIYVYINLSSSQEREGENRGMYGEESSVIVAHQEEVRSCGMNKCGALKYNLH
jgi:hypothetical protein